MSTETSNPAPKAETPAPVDLEALIEAAVAKRMKAIQAATPVKGGKSTETTAARQKQIAAHRDAYRNRRRV